MTILVQKANFTFAESSPTTHMCSSLALVQDLDTDLSLGRDLYAMDSHGIGEYHRAQ